MVQAQQKTETAQDDLKIKVNLVRVDAFRTPFNHYLVYIGGGCAKIEVPLGSQHDVSTFLKGFNAAVLALTGKQIEFPEIPTEPTHQAGRTGENTAAPWSRCSFIYI